MKHGMAILAVLILAAGTAHPAGDDAPQLLFQKGLHLETADADYKQAAALYAEIVEKHGDDKSLAAQALYRQGLCFEKLRRPDEAAAIFLKLSESYPEEIKSIYGADGKIAEFRKRLEKTQARVEADKNKPVTMALHLVDGSCIVGEPKQRSVEVATLYGNLDLPLSYVLDILVDHERGAVSVRMRDGTTVSGKAGATAFALTTEFGEITAELKNVERLEIRTSSGAIPKGLVLWNQLGSESDVKNSRVGPGGKLNGGRFVEGKFGNGVELNMNEQYGVTFPVETVSGPDGCVEFWAKLVDFPSGLAWGARPALLSGDDGKGAQHFIMLHLNGNDGQSNGGLIADIPGLANGATGQFGQWTYARALGADSVGDWHHYAMVWASDGIPGVDNGKRTVAAYVDGKLNSSIWRGAGGNIRPAVPATGRFGLLWQSEMQGGRVVFDNLKVWKYAKTDFSDRTQE